MANRSKKYKYHYSKLKRAPKRNYIPTGPLIELYGAMHVTHLRSPVADDQFDIILIGESHNDHKEKPYPGDYPEKNWFISEMNAKQYTENVLLQTKHATEYYETHPLIVENKGDRDSESKKKAQESTMK